MKTKPPIHNLGKFPPEEGMVVFGISMSSITTKQNPKNCFKYIEELVEKIELPRVGLTFLYSDNLYLYQEGDAANLNKKHQKLIIDHKSGFKNILDKNKWYIRDSFGFISWNQAILESKNFTDCLARVKQMYSQDKSFKKYVQEDIKSMGRRITKLNVLFVLEEIVLFYLISKGEIKFHNNFLQGKEKWVLFCYPGLPLKSEIYLFQKNPLKLKYPKNKYENSYYDLFAKKLYNYDKIDLKTFNP